NPCVTGDTLVATSEGLVRIDQMLDHEFEVLGSDGQFHRITAAFQTGSKPVYHLRTKAGFKLKVTADHKVLTTNRGDVAVCDLAKDDRVALGQGIFADGKHNGFEWASVHLDERLTEFLGLMIGDGCLMGEQETAMLTLAPEESAVATRIQDNLQ